MKNSKVMTCNNKYVITDTEHLISPAGFHPSMPIFNQTKVAIHCDVSPKRLPSSNVKLFLHNINSITEDGILYNE